MLATIVGSANGRSISALTSRLPRELVAHQHPRDQRAHDDVDQGDDHARPATVTRSAASAAGRGHRVPEAGRARRRTTSTVSAASGSSTMTLSHSVATPMPEGPTAAGDWRPPAPEAAGVRSAAGGAGRARSAVGAVESSLSSSASVGARRRSWRSEPVVLLEQRRRRRLVPATEVGDRPELLRRREVGGELRGDASGRPAGSRPRPSSCCASGVYRKSLNAWPAPGACCRSSTATGFSILKVVGGVTCSTGSPLRLGEQRLVLVAEQHVAGALQEGLGRLAAGLRLHLDVVADQLARGSRGRPAGSCRRRSWRRTARAGSTSPSPELNGFGRDDLDARLEQVVPVLDALGVALADDDGHDRAERDALVLVGVPVVVDQPGVDEAGDVGLDGEVDDVGLGAGLDLARLVARGAVGLG